MWERRESFFFAIIPGEVIPPEDWMDYLRVSRDGFAPMKQEYIAYKKRAMDTKSMALIFSQIPRDGL